MKMKKKLVEYIEQCLKSCTEDHSRIWFDHAFGAVEFAIAISSEKDFEILDALWDGYREKFIKVIWGA